MRIVTADEIDAVLTYPLLVEALREAFRSDVAVPARHHHGVQQDGAEATLLLMPAWTQSGERFLGCKIVTVFPDNVSRGLPSVYGNYILLAGDTGEPLAILEGGALTAWRTAAASALAATFLAREDASHLLMVGAGALAPHLVRAHAAVRPIRRVSLWNRNAPRAEALARRLAADGVEVNVVASLEAAAAEADIVCCATLAREPLILGRWLKPGAHLDLVGGFTPQMREADDEAVRRSRIYVDTRAGALKEGGDVVDPLRRKIISEADICGDLFDICRGACTGRRAPDEITLFKSVGTALEDLAAAILVWRRIAG